MKTNFVKTTKVEKNKIIKENHKPREMAVTPISKAKVETKI